MFNNVIKKVMNTRYKEDSGMTFAEAVKEHKGLHNIKWEKKRADYMGTCVTFTADIRNVYKFYSSCINYKLNSIDVRSMLTRSLFELMEYKKQMTLYYETEEIFSYLDKIRESTVTPNLLDFDFEKSSIRIYIQFIKYGWKEYKSISSGYTAKIKVSKPDLGYFGGLYNDMADGRKCISNIYSGDPITLHGSF